MKKIQLAILLLFLTNAIFAQEVHWGVKGGINFSNLKNGGNAADSRTGFNLGALAHIHVDPHFAIQPELMYSSQGAKYANGTSSKIDYINVPVLGQFMFGDGFRLQTGPQLGFLTSAESTNGAHSNDFKSSLKKTDVSWSFGAGYLTHAGLGLDARYNLGLTDISKANSDLKNSVWQIGLFYQFK